MSAFKSFVEIKSWQKARELNRLVYRETCHGVFAKDYDLRSQMRRASVSIMANIAEGFGRRSDKEFCNFLNIAQGSAREVQSHCYCALDLGYIDEKRFTDLVRLAEEITRMIFALMQHLQRKS